MRRITLWLFSTVAAVVLLFSYRTSTDSTAPGGRRAGDDQAAHDAGHRRHTDARDGRRHSGSSDGSSPGPGTSSSAKSGTSTGTKTYDGSVASTRWGDVQVTITVTGGRITDVSVPVYPDGNRRDQEINAYALPVLRQETLAAQSADINAVSGATVTSDGYLQSLQAALDAAHLA